MGDISQAISGRRRIRVAAAGAALLGSSAIAVVGPSLAQEVDPAGSDLYLDFRTGLVFSDNYEDLEDPSGNSTVWLTDVALTFDNTTRNQTIFTQIGASYEAGYFADREDDRGEVINPFITVGYALSNRSNVISFDAGYREIDNGFSDDDITGSRDLIVDEGTRAETDFDAVLDLGTDAPFGARFEASYDQLRYFDTTSPDLTDEERYGLDAIFRFRLNAATDLTFDVSYEERDVQDDVDTFEADVSVGIGFVYVARTGLTTTASLRAARDETTETIGGERVTSVEESPLIELRLEQPVSNGLVFGEIEQDLSDTGRRTYLIVGRSFDLRTGDFAFSFGVTRGEEDSELRAVGSLDYRHELPRGALEFGIESTVFNDDDDGEVIAGEARLRWEQALTQISGVSLEMSYTASDAIEADGTDRSLALVELAYEQALTEDWSFITGYRHGTSRETDTEPVIENEIFANIGRRFSIRP